MVGSFLMLVLLLYSARKRLRSMQRAGNIRYWLNYHIWMGVTGPLLVILHTTFKFGGIVSISFWSMIAVALSGVLGRYIYIQIPRAMNGEELSERELDQMDQELTARLRERYRVRDEVLALLDALSGAASAARQTGLAGLVHWIAGDLIMPLKLRTIRRALRELAPRSEVSQTMKLVKRTVRLRRRRAFLASAHSLLHHWHVVHKPFAVVMLLVMLVHVAVTVMFGYTWVF
jgi:hypothetical protein